MSKDNSLNDIIPKGINPEEFIQAKARFLALKKEEYEKSEEAFVNLIFTYLEEKAKEKNLIFTFIDYFYRDEDYPSSHIPVLKEDNRINIIRFKGFETIESIFEEAGIKFIWNEDVCKLQTIDEYWAEFNEEKERILYNGKDIFNFKKERKCF
jgi:hypothetical protein